MALSVSIINTENPLSIRLLKVNRKFITTSAYKTDGMSDVSFIISQHEFQLVSCTAALACTGVMVSKEIKNEASNGRLGTNPGG